MAIGIARRIGIAAADRRMGLFVGAHFAIASGQFGNFKLLEALLLWAGFGLVLPVSGLGRLPAGLIRFVTGASGWFISRGGRWRSGSGLDVDQRT